MEFLIPNIDKYQEHVSRVSNVKIGIYLTLEPQQFQQVIL